MIGRIDSVQDAFRRKLKYVHDYRQTEQRPTSQEVNENSRQLYANVAKRGKTRENADDPDAVCFTFASDWLRKWREVSGPITGNRERFKRGKTQITKTHFVSFLHLIGSENGESLHDQF